MSALDTLRHQVHDADLDGKIKAARALGESGDAEAFPVLINLLDTADNPRIRNAAAIGLRDLADNRALPFLLAQIKEPKNVDHRGTLVYALETLDARSALVDLVELIGSGDYEVATMAIRVIESFRGPVAVEATQKAKKALRRYRRATPEDEWRREALGFTGNLLNHLSAV